MKRVDLPWPNAIVVAGEATETWFEFRGADTRVAGVRLGDWFSEAEIAAVAEFKLEKRRREWVASRVAAKQLALERDLCADPRSCIVERGRLTGTKSSFLSLSHSEPYAAAAVGESPVGIDVQAVRDLSDRAAHLFLAPDEIESMESLSVDQRLLHFWCAKEAAWKQRGGSVQTLRQIPIRLVEMIDSGLRFDVVETFATGDVIVALTR
jgi:phosphopantetheinyl transferase